MSVNGKAAPASTPLHAKMEARGAKKHQRKSSLARFMIERAAEMQRLVEVDRYSWKDIAAMLTEDEGLTDTNGNPVTDTIAKLTWSRVKRERTANSRHSRRPTPQAPALPDDTSSQNIDLPLANRDPVEMHIRPVGLRQNSTASAAKPSEIPGVTLLSDTEVRRRLDDLAARQAGKKIPPPKVM